MRRACAALLALSGVHFALALPPEPGRPALPERGEKCLVPEPAFPDRAALDALAPIPARVFQLDTSGREIAEIPADFRDRGVSNNRINLVFVGDGYLSTEMGQYVLDVQSGVSQLFSNEPFYTYRNFFAIFRVDVISNVSGVSGDPTPDISKATPLSMNFWCNGTERLLCVNTTAARQYANNAPFPPDQVLAVANSFKYGGAGYSSADVGTYAGANFAAPEVAIHELGHAFGDLADEYEYDGPTTHVQSEPAAADVSIYPHATMLAQSKKWFRWLGVNDPSFDGLQDTYEGGDHSYFGIYRPSYDSKMRNLYRPFNLPSAEALITAIYKVVKPIDSTTPAVGSTVNRLQTISLSLLQPVDHPLKVEWLTGNTVIPGVTGTSWDLSTFNFRKGANTVRCRVTDEIPWVKNPTTKTNLMKLERTWFIFIAACLGDLSGDRFVDDVDFVLFVAAYNELLTAAGDMNNDGLTDDADFVIFVAQYDALICP